MIDLKIIQPDQSGFVWFHRIIDVVLPLSLLFLITFYSDVAWHDRYLTMGLLGGLIFVFSSQIVGIYHSWRGRSIFSSVQHIIKAWLLTWVTLIVIAFLYDDIENFSRISVVVWFFITPLMLVFYRVILRMQLSFYRSKGNNTQTVAIIGAGKVGQHIANTIRENPWLGYRVCGFYDDDQSLCGSEVVGFSVLGGTSKIAESVNENGFKEVYICLPLGCEKKIKQILNDLTDTTSIVKFVPDLFTFDLMHTKWSELKGVPIFSVYDTPLNYSTSRFLKRFEDIIISIIILLFIAPVLVLLAIGVKISSPGPIFYKQSRISWNGESFNILKFRSMPVGSDQQKIGIEGSELNDKPETKVDSRFGAFIRQYSLDELPQFINVLKGEMSIVGPRPERTTHVPSLRKTIPRYMQKHMVKAGITGWAQINGWRGDSSLEKRIEFDLHYIQNWSLLFDLKIIIITMLKGFINK